MRLEGMELEGFRNYDRASLTFDENCNVIYGDNAQGKTNLLEAIQYLACGKSNRARSDRELIGFDREFACLSGNIHTRERNFVARIELHRGRKRKMSVNGVTAKNAAALSAVLHTVFFSPEDLFLIRDGAAARRRFMDLSLCQLRPRYAEALAEHNRLYEHKNRILRDCDGMPKLLEMLPEFNEQLVQVGAVLLHYRARFCQALDRYAKAAHAECSGGRECLRLSYKTVSSVCDPMAELSKLTAQLRAHQASHEQAEIASHTCLSGVHKDDIEVSVNGYNARQFCSQGQARTAALSMKLAEREIHRNTFGEYPLMLLDDVLSELDPKRQEYVLNRIAGGQVFITCCEEDRLDTLLQGKMFRVHEGRML